jgi:hypothetical protein
MIELFLSTDGKHTVHVTADTLAQLRELVPAANALYQEVLASYGTKAQMWSAAMQGNGHSNGQTTVEEHSEPVAQAQELAPPRCPLHQTPLRYREGRLGPFWSCPRRQPDGRWCQVTQEVTTTSNGHAGAA